MERGGLVDDHPDSVATTWSISFRKVEQKSPAAAELLRLCAFLAPDAIPEEIITKGAEHLGPVLQAAANDPMTLNKAIAALGAYSLIRRDPAEKTLSVHRLVQAVLRDAMSEDEAKLWVERTVLAVNEACPAMEFEMWVQWERYLPHALACADLVEQGNLMLLEATHLLNETGNYLRERARYTEAELLYKRALTICEKHPGPVHSTLITILNNLAITDVQLKKYVEAESLYRCALTICQQHLSPAHFLMIWTWQNLADVCVRQLKFAEAESLYWHTLTICEQHLSLTHPATTSSLNHLAHFIGYVGKFEEAESLYQRAIPIYEQHLKLAISALESSLDSLENLALFFNHLQTYTQAELLYQHALKICEQQRGPTHPTTASILNQLANTYQLHWKFEEAQQMYQRSLRIYEQHLDPIHPTLAVVLCNLAETYTQLYRLEEAEPLYKRALAIQEQSLGPEHPHTRLTQSHYNILLIEIINEEEYRSENFRKQRQAEIRAMSKYMQEEPHSPMCMYMPRSWELPASRDAAMKLMDRDI